MIIVIPWHWYEYVQFGPSFFNDYFVHQAVGRYAEGISSNNSGFQLFEYGKLLFVFHEPWITLFLVTSVIAVIQWRRKKISLDPFFVSCVAITFAVYLFFGFGKTRILTYLLPLFPFVALVVAQGMTVLWHTANRIIRLLISAVVIGGAVYAFLLGSGIVHSMITGMYYFYSPDEKAIGTLVRKGTVPATTFYMFNWPTRESFRYYSGHEPVAIGYPPPANTVLQGPWFLFLTNVQIDYFLNKDGTVKSQFKHLELNYTSSYFYLLSGDQDLSLDSTT